MSQVRRDVGKYHSFAELTRHEADGRDYKVRWFDRRTASAIVIAPHGGMIEVGTSEIAELIAGLEHSLFCFEGMKPYDTNRDLHITSHRFDHPRCLELTATHDAVLSVHGCQGEACIFLGGLDSELKAALARELRAAGFDVVAAGHRYPGRHPLNICNRGARARGAQLEITYDLRAKAQHRETIALAARAALAAFTGSRCYGSAGRCGIM